MGRTASVIEGGEDEATVWLSSEVARCVVRCDQVDGEGEGEGESEVYELVDDDDASCVSSTVVSLDDEVGVVDGLRVRGISMMPVDHANKNIKSPVLGVLTV